MADWFSQNAPAQQGGDWFATNAPGLEPLPATVPNRETFLGGLKKNLVDAPIEFVRSMAASAMKTHPAAQVAFGPLATAYQIGKDHIPGMVSAQGEQFTRAGEEFRRGEYLPAAGRALAGAVPLVGPAAAAAADTITGTEPKYDSKGNVIESGIEPNVAAGLGEAAGMLLPFGAKPAMRATGQVAAKAAPALEASAHRQYSRVLNATTRGNKARSAEVVPELIKRGEMALTTKGLQQRAAGQARKFGELIGEAHENLPGDATVPLGNIQATIRNAANEAFSIDTPGGRISMGPNANTGLGHAGELSAVLERAAIVDQATGELVIPVATVRRLRQYYDRVGQQAGRYDAKTLADHSSAEAHGMAADAIRQELAKQFPDIATLNKEYSFWKDVDRVLSDTLLRREGQAKPLGQKILAGIGAGAGYAKGGITGAVIGKAAMAALEAATTSPGWRTVSAVVVDRLAKAIAGGQRGAIALYAHQARRQAQQGATAPPSGGQSGPPAPPGMGPASPGPAPAAQRNPIAAAPNSDTLPAYGQQATGQAPALHPRAIGAGQAVPRPAGTIPGATQTRITVPGGAREYAASFQISELDDIQPSHSGQNFQPNPRYKLKNDRDYTKRDNQGKVVENALENRFDPRYHISDNPDATNGPPIVDANGDVLGGNGRAMMLDRVYASNPNGAKAYRDLLTQKAAQFGLDPATIDGMRRPVLVRRLDDSADFSSQDAITDFNKPGTAALRPNERAIADSRRVSQGTLDDIAGRLDAIGEGSTLAQALEGRGGTEVLNRLISDGIISPQERAAFASGDVLTVEGKARISKLMLGRFFRDPAQLDVIAPSVRNKLERIAAPLARVEGSTEWNLTPAIQEAIDLIEEAGSHGTRNLDDFIKQNSLFGDQAYSAKAVALAKAIQSKGALQLSEAVKRYAQDAGFATEGPGLFGDAPTPEASFREAFGGKSSGIPENVSPAELAKYPAKDAVEFLHRRGRTGK